MLIRKIVLLGDSGVGKTNLMLRITEGAFEEKEKSTIGVEFGTKFLKNAKGETEKLQIWDTAGQERFRSIASVYYRNASGILLVCEKETPVTSLEMWIKQIRFYASESVFIILACNKCDLPFSGFTEDQLDFAEKHKLKTFEVSAKTNQNVLKVFQYFLTQPCPSFLKKEVVHSSSSCTC
jgi:small GTP-binding protein